MLWTKLCLTKTGVQKVVSFVRVKAFSPYVSSNSTDRVCGVIVFMFGAGSTKVLIARATNDLYVWLPCTPFATRLCMLSVFCLVVVPSWYCCILQGNAPFPHK